MQPRELNATHELTAWDDWVLRHADASHVQLAWWTRWQQMPLVRTSIVAAMDDDQILGGAALYHFGIPFIGPRVTIVPNGPLVAPDCLEELPTLVRAIIACCRRARTAILQFESYSETLTDALREALCALPSEPDVIWRLYHPGLWRDTRVVVRGRTAEDLLMSFSPDTRYRIRQAIKKGYEVAPCTTEADLRVGYEIWRDSASDNGYVPRPWNNFLGLATAGARAGAAWALACRYRGQALGFSFNVQSGRGISGIVLAHRRLREAGPVPRILNWHCIALALDLGLDYYSFGAPMRGSNQQFKESFAPQIVDNRRFTSVLLRPYAARAIRKLVSNTRFMLAGKKTLARLGRLRLGRSKSAFDHAARPG